MATTPAAACRRSARRRSRRGSACASTPSRSATDGGRGGGARHPGARGHRQGDRRRAFPRRRPRRPRRHLPPHRRDGADAGTGGVLAAAHAALRLAARRLRAARGAAAARPDLRARCGGASGGMSDLLASSAPSTSCGPGGCCWRSPRRWHCCWNARGDGTPGAGAAWWRRTCSPRCWSRRGGAARLRPGAPWRRCCSRCSPSPWPGRAGGGSRTPSSPTARPWSSRSTSRATRNRRSRPASARSRDLVAARAGARTGLVAYAGTAHPALPPTDDTEADRDLSRRALAAGHAARRRGGLGRGADARRSTCWMPEPGAGRWSSSRLPCRPPSAPPSTPPCRAAGMPCWCWRPAPAPSTARRVRRW